MNFELLPGSLELEILDLELWDMDFGTFAFLLLPFALVDVDGCWLPVYQLLPFALVDVD